MDWIRPERSRRFWKRVRARVEAREPLVFALPLDQARAQAEAILLAGDGWKCHDRVGSPPPGVSILAPSLQALFSRWSEIERNADMSVVFCDDASEVLDTADSTLDTSDGTRGPDEVRPVLISSTLDWQESLHVFRGDELVYEVVPYPAARIGGEEKVYPSIWHWILVKNIQKEILRSFRST